MQIVKMGLDDDLFDGFVDPRMYSCLNVRSGSNVPNKDRHFYDRNVIVAPVTKLSSVPKYSRIRHDVRRRKKTKPITNKASYPRSDSDESQSSNPKTVHVRTSQAWSSQRVPIYIYNQSNNKYLPKVGKGMYKCRDTPICSPVVSDCCVAIEEKKAEEAAPQVISQQARVTNNDTIKQSTINVDPCTECTNARNLPKQGPFSISKIVLTPMGDTTCCPPLPRRCAEIQQCIPQNRINIDEMTRPSLELLISNKSGNVLAKLINEGTSSSCIRSQEPKSSLFRYNEQQTFFDRYPSKSHSFNQQTDSLRLISPRRSSQVKESIIDKSVSTLNTQNTCTKDCYAKAVKCCMKGSTSIQLSPEDLETFASNCKNDCLLRASKCCSQRSALKQPQEAEAGSSKVSRNSSRRTKTSFSQEENLYDIAPPDNNFADVPPGAFRVVSKCNTCKRRTADELLRYSNYSDDKSIVQEPLTRKTISKLGKTHEDNELSLLEPSKITVRSSRRKEPASKVSIMDDRPCVPTCPGKPCRVRPELIESQESTESSDEDYPLENRDVRSSVGQENCISTCRRPCAEGRRSKRISSIKIIDKLAPEESDASIEFISESPRKSKKSVCNPSCSYSDSNSGRQSRAKPIKNMESIASVTSTGTTESISESEKPKNVYKQSVKSSLRIVTSCGKLVCDRNCRGRYNELLEVSSRKSSSEKQSVENELDESNTDPQISQQRSSLIKKSGEGISCDPQCRGILKTKEELSCNPQCKGYFEQKEELSYDPPFSGDSKTKEECNPQCKGYFKPKEELSSDPQLSGYSKPNEELSYDPQSSSYSKPKEELSCDPQCNAFTKSKLSLHSRASKMSSGNLGRKSRISTPKKLEPIASVVSAAVIHSGKESIISREIKNYSMPSPVDIELTNDKKICSPECQGLVVVEDEPVESVKDEPVESVEETKITEELPRLEKDPHCTSRCRMQTLTVLQNLGLAGSQSIEAALERPIEIVEQQIDSYQAIGGMYAQNRIIAQGRINAQDELSCFEKCRQLFLEHERMYGRQMSATSRMPTANRTSPKSPISTASPMSNSIRSIDNTENEMTRAKVRVLAKDSQPRTSDKYERSNRPKTTTYSKSKSIKYDESTNDIPPKAPNTLQRSTQRKSAAKDGKSETVNNRSNNESTELIESKRGSVDPIVNKVKKSKTKPVEYSDSENSLYARSSHPKKSVKSKSSNSRKSIVKLNEKPIESEPIQYIESEKSLVDESSETKIPDNRGSFIKTESKTSYRTTEVVDPRPSNTQKFIVEPTNSKSMKSMDSENILAKMDSEPKFSNYSENFMKDIKSKSSVQSIEANDRRSNTVILNKSKSMKLVESENSSPSIESNAPGGPLLAKLSKKKSKHMSLTIVRSPEPSQINTIPEAEPDLPIQQEPEVKSNHSLANLQAVQRRISKLERELAERQLALDVKSCPGDRICPGGGRQPTYSCKCPEEGICPGARRQPVFTSLCPADQIYPGNRFPCACQDDRICPGDRVCRGHRRQPVFTCPCQGEETCQGEGWQAAFISTSRCDRTCPGDKRAFTCSNPENVVLKLKYDPAKVRLKNPKCTAVDCPSSMRAENVCRPPKIILAPEQTDSREILNVVIDKDEDPRIVKSFPSQVFSPSKATGGETHDRLPAPRSEEFQRQQTDLASPMSSYNQLQTIDSKTMNSSLDSNMPRYRSSRGVNDAGKVELAQIAPRASQLPHVNISDQVDQIYYDSQSIPTGIQNNSHKKRKSSERSKRRSNERRSVDPTISKDADIVECSIGQRNSRDSEHAFACVKQFPPCDNVACKATDNVCTCATADGFGMYHANRQYESGQYSSSPRYSKSQQPSYGYSGDTAQSYEESRRGYSYPGSYAFVDSKSACRQCSPGSCSRGHNMPLSIGYATTVVSRFPKYTIYEILKSTTKRPANLSQLTENVFVIKTDNLGRNCSQ